MRPPQSGFGFCFEQDDLALHTLPMKIELQCEALTGSDVSFGVVERLQAD